jgi:hypothetical protein
LDVRELLLGFVVVLFVVVELIEQQQLERQLLRRWRRFRRRWLVQ